MIPGPIPDIVSFFENELGFVYKEYCYGGPYVNHYYYLVLPDKYQTDAWINLIYRNKELIVELRGSFARCDLTFMIDGNNQFDHNELKDLVLKSKIITAMTLDNFLTYQENGVIIN